MKKSGDNFGINMKQYCREHDAAVMDALNRNAASDDKDAEDLAAALERHLEMIARLQHERLVHLIVTVMVVFTELFVVDLAVLHPELGILPAIIMLGLAILLGFYFYHYFFLENTVQHWYKLADQLQTGIKASDVNERIVNV